MTPRVSIVITCRNQAQFLAEAIESALAQTYPDTETVLVDDGSTDGTAEVAGRYPRVRLVSQPHTGLSAARNTGLAQSTGEMIAFLDADDRLLPNAVETGVRALTDHPEAACAVGHHRLIDAGGAITAEWTRAPVDADPYAALLRRNHIGMHATVLYRRSVLDEVGPFDTALRKCEDYDLLLRIARSHGIYVHGVLIAEYRRHASNMSRDPIRMLKAVLRVHGRQWSYVRRRPEYWDAYRAGRAFWHDFYGGQMVRQVQADAANVGHVGRLVRGVAALAIYHPGGFIETYRDVVRAVLTPRARRHVRRYARQRLCAIARHMIPAPLRDVRRRLLRRLNRATRAGDAPGQQGSPGRPAVRFGDLRRVTPISPTFGFDRGQPVDRVYIEAFLAQHSADVRGRVLEFGDPAYTRRFGADRVEQSDVWHVAAGHPEATVVGDLTCADHVPSNVFDCVICTQTLHLVYDLRAAVRTLHRILKPGGIVLATVPGVSRVAPDEWREPWCWSLTVTSARRLFAECFPTDQIEVDAHGNVLAAAAFLYGLASHELRPEEIGARDPHYPVVVTVRARKPLAG
jgi:glycosyltransferase involved in cell wall biosynthesis